VLASTNAGGLVNFPAGTKTVRMTFPGMLFATLLPGVGMPSFAAVEIDDFATSGLADRGVQLILKQAPFFPVLTLRPKTAGKPSIMDFCPNEVGGAIAGYQSWADWCDKDFHGVTQSQLRSARVGIRADRGARFGAMAFGDGAVPPDIELHIQEVVKARINAAGMLVGSPTVGAIYNGYHTYYPNPGGTDVNGVLFSNTNTAGFGTVSDHPVTFFVNNSPRWTMTTTAFHPGADNAYSLGLANRRASVIYAGTSTINTSDARLKADRDGVDLTGGIVSPMSDAEIAAAREIAREIGIFTFRDAVAEKGAAARLHAGVTVQCVIEIMERHGLEPFRYAFICFDKWNEEPDVPARTEEVMGKKWIQVTRTNEKGEEVTESVETDEDIVIGTVEHPALPGIAAGDRYGFRMEGLLAFIARGQEARLQAIEAALAA